MSAELNITRRAFGAGIAWLGLGTPAWSQGSSGLGSAGLGFAGLGSDAAGYARVTPGKAFIFPADHGPHPDFRIEWWYVTANLVDAGGVAYGAQWTLFRQALAPGAQQEGWGNQQIWMAHAAVTRADTHRTAETFARGGVGQAGVTVEPFEAWIDSWKMRGLDGFNADMVSPLELSATGKDFTYALRLEADRPFVLQGDRGYSRKSDREQASYYYSQPFLNVSGRLAIDDKQTSVTGHAWMDREWSSQPLAPDQTGWDWFAFHLAGGEKLMLYRMRQKDGRNSVSGTWILPDASTRQLNPADITMTPHAPADIEGHRLPVQWRIEIASLALAIEIAPLNPGAWMGTSFSYWEGPISFRGSHTGVGYLELTGY